MRTALWSAMALSLTLAVAAPAAAQNLSLQAPAWAQPLLATDVIATTGGRAAIATDGVPIAARVTIAPTGGGVARVIRYETHTDGALLAVRRFTGHPTTGWWMWGPDTARVTHPAQAARTEIENLARASMNASAAGAGGPVATTVQCSGEQAFVEVAVDGRAVSFTKACVSNVDAVGRLALRLSALAGSRDNEELAEAAEQELLEADRAFAALAAAEGVPAAFARYAASDAIMLRSEGEPTIGSAAVAARFANWPQGAQIQWTPETARVASRGDMGWTWGNAVQIGADGTRSPGRYVTTWKRDDEGNWRFALDAGVD